VNVVGVEGLDAESLGEFDLIQVVVRDVGFDSFLVRGVLGSAATVLGCGVGTIESVGGAGDPAEPVAGVGDAGEGEA
jgi:hypothetical protein